MTEKLIDRLSWLTVFEIDPQFCLWLQNSIGESMRHSPGKFKIVKGDFCSTWAEEWQLQKPDRVVGNLPYNSASRIMGIFMENVCMPERCVFTVQNEMSQRMMAKTDSYHYSSFSVICQASAIIRDGGYLPASFFYPRPRVSSRIVILERRTSIPTCRRGFGDFVRGMFTHRRKTLRNNLNVAKNNSQVFSRENIEHAFLRENISLSLRPQNLDPEKWLAIFSHLKYPGIP